MRSMLAAEGGHLIPLQKDHGTLEQLAPRKWDSLTSSAFGSYSQVVSRSNCPLIRTLIA